MKYWKTSGSSHFRWSHPTSCCETVTRLEDSTSEWPGWRTIRSSKEDHKDLGKKWFPWDPPQLDVDPFQVNKPSWAGYYSRYAQWFLALYILAEIFNASFLVLEFPELIQPIPLPALWKNRLGWRLTTPWVDDPGTHLAHYWIPCKVIEIIMETRLDKTHENL